MEEVVDLVRGEVGAVRQAAVLGEAFPSDGAGIFGRDVGEEGDVKTHHDLIRVQDEVMGEFGELLRILHMVNRVAHQRPQDVG